MLFGVIGTRALALQLLQRIENDGAYANLVVPAALSSSGLEPRDRAFVTELVYGSTRMRRACDSVIDRFVLSEPDAVTRSVLRLGAYQLVFAGVPPHAAVGETVSLAPKRTRGFVNAVLRKISRLQVTWPDEATELSYPDWIVDRLHAELGEEARAALARMNEAPPVSVRDDGYTQDRSSQWVAAAVGALPGERVFDMCAAPGGKATAMAARSVTPGAFVPPTCRRLGAGSSATTSPGWAPTRSLCVPTAPDRRSRTAASTGCCSMRRARGSVPCGAGPTRGGASHRTRSTTSPHCRPVCWPALRRSSGPVARSCTASAR